MKTIDNKIVYEVGDWVTVTGYPRSWSSSYGNCPSDAKYPFTGEIIQRSTDDSIGVCGYGLDLGALIENKMIRLATQDEINKATKEETIYVGNGDDYIVEFTANREPYEGCTELRIGCVTVTKDKFLKIKKRAGW